MTVLDKDTMHTVPKLLIFAAVEKKARLENRVLNDACASSE